MLRIALLVVAVAARGSGCPREPVCGNGELEGNEECDEGAANSDTAPDTCRADCGLAACGDDICDYADADGSCPADCVSVCGDGLCEYWAGETHAECPVDCGLLWWVAEAGGTAPADSAAGNGIAALADGSGLVVGYFSGTATFGLSEPFETTLVSAGEGNLFVARYGP
jgi:hypothetical protein